MFRQLYMHSLSHSIYLHPQEEKPVFVFLRPDSTTSKKTPLYSPYRANPSLGSQMDHLTSSPSPSALQQQLELGRLLAAEAIKISNLIQELNVGNKLQCMGWKALMNNFSSIHRLEEWLWDGARGRASGRGYWWRCGLGAGLVKCVWLIGMCVCVLFYPLVERLRSIIEPLGGV